MPPDPFRKWMIDGDYPPAQSFALEAHTHPGGGTLHEDLTDVTSDQHHAASHTHASHTGIGAGDHHAAFVQADHDGLPNPHHSNANDHAAAHTLASHSTRAHSELTGVGATDHHSNALDHSNASDHTRAHVVAQTLDHTFPGGTTFLRADGTWASPPGGSEAFPVGSVFIAVVSTNPGTLLGYGTWSAFGAGRMLVGLDSGQTEFDVVEETGGTKTHTLLESEIPAHVHAENAPTSASGGALRLAVDTNASGSVAAGLDTASAGGGAAHNNLPPYIVVYMWKRTA